VIKINKKKKILVTGSTGFVGKQLVKDLNLKGYKLKYNQSKFRKLIDEPDIKVSRWSLFLKDVETIIHCSGKTPGIGKKNFFERTDYFKSNVYSTAILAEQAILNGVKQLIYISSESALFYQYNKISNRDKSTFLNINKYSKVSSGDQWTFLNIKSSEAYALSKKQAENVLNQKHIFNKLNVTIIRPSLIYGPKVKGSFLILLKWLSFGLPVPNFGPQKKAFLGLDNFIDFVICCLKFPNKATGTFNIADKEIVTINNFLILTSELLKKKLYFFYIPEFLFNFTLKVFGNFSTKKKINYQRIKNNSKAKILLGWDPPISQDVALKKTIKWFKGKK
jgi:nucleoside-diphosphate-sugar epimerase